MATKKDLVHRMCDLIEEGQLDAYLEVIGRECFNRRKHLHELRGRKKLRELSELGTRVRLVQGRPKYLIGYAGEVVERPDGFSQSNKDLLYVKLDVGRVRRYGPVVATPASMLEAE